MKTTEKLELLAPESLQPSGKNPRRHTARQMKQLRHSLNEFGFVAPVLIDRKGRIVAGEAMVEAAKAQGMEKIPCVRVEHLTDKQLRAYKIADNRLAELSSWNDDILETCLHELFAEGVDLMVTGFGEYKLSDALAAAPAPPKTEDTKAGECCTHGSLWQLGSHRLLCGDATNAEDVARLMGGERALLLLTDPPYNVDYHGGTAAHLSIQNDNMPSERFVAFLTDAFAAARTALKPGAGFYIWYGANSTFEFVSACHAAGLTVRQYLVWVKNHFTLGRQDYKWQHEPCLAGRAASYEGCLYGWDDRAPHRWFGGDGQSTVYQFDKPASSEEHPTMKPVELFARQIRSSTRKGDIVLDPFCGSGTSILAAESYGRRCFAMELDPQYCAVIIQRWEEKTGQKAVLLEGGAANVRDETAD